MPEVEVKILEVDSGALQDQLEKLGATKVFEGNLQASLFDFPDQRLNAEDSFVRLRTKGDEIELVYKKRIPDAIARSYHELQIVVSDRNTTQQILEAIGLQEMVRGRNKHRISYALEDAHFEIDTIEGMPTYLEIEVDDSTKLQKWVEAFGYSMADTKAWVGEDLYKHYNVPYPRV